MKKFCFGVTLYNPTDKQIMNLTNYINCAGKIYVYDNSEKKNQKLIDIIKKNNKIQYITFNKNNGLSKAFNYICNLALSENFEYICLMDQDSVFTENNIKLIENEIEYHEDNNVALYVPKIKYINSYEEIFFDEMDSNNLKNSTRNLKWAITSGSFINLKLHKIIGEFDENYFIDRVDLDYCKNIKKNKFLIKEISKCNLFQFLGDRINDKSKYSEHNSIRHYYIFRNRLYFYNKYRKDYNIIKRNFIIFFGSLKQIFNILILENNKIDKLNMIYKGFRDYSSRNMGKFKR